MRKIQIAIVLSLMVISVANSPARISRQGFPARSLKQQKSKDPNKAFLMSLIVPGTGQLYSGAKRGYYWIGSEIAFVAASIFTHNKAIELRDDYVQLVRDGVVFYGTNDRSRFDDWILEDFEHATMYGSWHNVYNETINDDNEAVPIDRVGKWYWSQQQAHLLTENNPDDSRKLSIAQKKQIDDSSDRREALEQRTSSNDRFELARKLVGFVILNHVASAVDARIAAKIHNSQGSANRSFDIDTVTTFLPNRGIESKVLLRKTF